MLQHSYYVAQRNYNILLCLGKSTCMGMLCGTLDATFGDASVNGYSISNERTLARRNLGIAMQQDIIWV